MHHFTSVVAIELANGSSAEAKALWQEHAVKLGFKHHFLLRGILAVAAFHLGFLYPERKAEYYLAGTTHQSIGLTEFQATLPDVNESNCHALFAFSCLVIILVFASGAKEKPMDFNTDVLQWFYLLRGAHIVLNLHKDSISCSFLKPLLDEMGRIEAAEAQQFPGTEQITRLFRICGSDQHDQETAQAYDLAIHGLLNTFTQVSLLRQRGDGTILTTFVWPIHLSPRFLDLLSEKQPAAMIVLAHYCVLIHWGEEKDTHETWFVEGWASYMLTTVRESIPEEWEEHLKWPTAMIT
jgi:hypothetical protein